MKRNEIFEPGKYVKNHELGGEPRVRFIRYVGQEWLKDWKTGGQTKKGVLYFEDDDLGALILNAGHWDVLAVLYGEESDDWIGKPIELFPTEVEVDGKTYQVVRLRKPSNSEEAEAAESKQHQQQKKPLHDELSDEVPF
jgi:hypothetical protein